MFRRSPPDAIKTRNEAKRGHIMGSGKLIGVHFWGISSTVSSAVIVITCGVQ